ncbi:MAG: phosphomethylpyrimidine synthase ThiC [Phycisphaerae bacterium]|nr:phosphomethylpyrimidine synthase ThiC [Phycisphaerae bacterium]
MTTQYRNARDGAITQQMRRVACREKLPEETIRDEIAAGRLVIPANRVHLNPSGDTATPLDPCGIGRAVGTKINANIGSSPDSSCKDAEFQKLAWAVRYGADAVMDLSTGGDLDEIRTHLIANCSVPLGTVPIYSMIIDKPVEELTRDDILSTIARQAAQGVDFFTIHAGLLRDHIPLACKRKMGIVSRGGSLLAKWMDYHNRENPMYELFDEISAIMLEYDVTYSLGDGLRPGCLADASDEAQFAELDVLGELVFRARDAGVQVMVEGPGHVPFNEIEMNVKRQQEVCDGAPFYVLGPIVSDVFPGYDHITSTIGATAAAYAGASFLCYVTPSEHLSLPTPEDVKAGCIAYKIAAHAADVARGLPGARDWDDEMSDARAKFEWEKQFDLAFDSETAREIRTRDLDTDVDYCSMCGHDWCAMRISAGLVTSVNQSNATDQTKTPALQDATEAE